MGHCSISDWDPVSSRLRRPSCRQAPPLPPLWRFASRGTVGKVDFKSKGAPSEAPVCQRLRSKAGSQFRPAALLETPLEVQLEAPLQAPLEPLLKAPLEAPLGAPIKAPSETMSEFRPALLEAPLEVQLRGSIRGSVRGSTSSGFS